MNIKNQLLDAIVVGSGPGGATVAKELSQRNKKVLILEWGDNAPLTGSLLARSQNTFGSRQKFTFY